jgi:hypothetical protein
MLFGVVNSLDNDLFTMPRLCMVGGNIKYHVHYNIGLVICFLNFAKRQHLGTIKNVSTPYKH